MRKTGLFWCLIAALALGGERMVTLDSSDSLRGAALDGTRLVAWGNSLYEWDTRTWKQHTIAGSVRGVGEGGCVNRSGGVLLQDGVEGGPLVLISRSGRREVWDRNVDLHDCVFTTLLGRSGALITNHYGQVRFYEAPERYREIYSFYTASRQAGLLLRDVDGDGFTDIFAGNYWIRSPREFALPWRLFAVNTRHETPDSATMTLAFRAPALYAAQGHLADGAVFEYRPGSDAAQLWHERVLAEGLRYPHAVAAGRFGLLVAENGGAGSGVYLAGAGERLTRIGVSGGFHSAFELGGRVVLVGARAVELWDVQRRK